MTTWAEDFEEAANGEPILYAVLSPLANEGHGRVTTDEIYLPIPWHEARDELAYSTPLEHGVYAWTDNYVLAFVGGMCYGYDMWVARFPRNIAPCAVSLWME